MKRLIYIFMTLNFLFPSNEGKGVIKNIILPGWGFQDMNKSENHSKKYFLRETIIWSTFFTAKNSSNLFKDYYASYSIDYADTDVFQHESGYSINVGNYDSMFLYNQAMLRKRNPDNVYPENQGYEWEWDSSNNRLKYKKMLQVSRDLDKIGDFAIAGLIVHRMISVINYIYYSRTGSTSKLSSELLKSDQNTVLLNFKFQF